MVTTKSKNRQNCHTKQCVLDLPCSLPVIIMLLGYCTQGLFANCPHLCECKWKGGKEAVSCKNANFTAVPLNLDHGTQMLDLSNNNLGRLRIDEFKKAGLINLQKIHLTKCRIKIIEKFAFRNLLNVVEVDLSYNFLEMVPTHILMTLPELRELRLNGNLIQRIGNDAFLNAPYLEKLEMSFNRIGTIDTRAFVGVEKSLQRLLLDGNRLTEVQAISFSSLKSLNALEISSNPWNCSCTIRSFREWMSKQNVPVSVNPVCKYPQRLKGKAWNTLELDEFACVPKILAPDPKAHGVEGGAIILSCKIDGIPEPHVKWLLKNKVIANHTASSFTIGKKSYLLKSEKNLSLLTIPTADMQDAGIYICAAENKAGKVEASVTLAVTKKPPEESTPTKAIIAGIVVAIVVIVAICTVFVCLISVRKRRQSDRWRSRRSTSVRRHDDNYEKIEMNYKIANNKTGTNIAVASVASEVPVMGPVRRNGEYRGVPNMDTDQEPEPDEDEEIGYEDNAETPTPTNVNKTNETKLWTAAATGRSISSPNGGHWNSNLIENNLNDTNLDPDDLHIPRRTKEETRDDCMKTPSSIFGTYNIDHHQNHPNSSNFFDIHIDQNQTPKITQKEGLAFNVTSHKQLHPHILRKQILQEGGSLYSSIPVASTDFEDTETQYSSRLDLSAHKYQQGINLDNFTSISSQFMPDGMSIHSDDNMYCTLPRKKFTSSRRSSHCNSESPLLPGSRCGSSGGESNIGLKTSFRRLSEDYSYYGSRTNIYPNLNQRTGSYLSLVSSKQNLFMPSTTATTSSKSNYDTNHLDSTPLLNVNALEKRYNELKSPSSKLAISSASKMSEYRSSQLEKLVVGKCHQMENQMKQLKEACDNLKKLEEYKKQLKSKILFDSILHGNIASFSDCEDYTPKSILKKPASSSTTSSQSPLFVSNLNIDSSVTSGLSRDDFNKDLIETYTNDFKRNYFQTE